jgi:hypothetical protein
MAGADIKAVCKDFDLPMDLIKKIFWRADTNRDNRWNIDEFIPAMHRIIHEIDERDGMLNSSYVS